MTRVPELTPLLRRLQLGPMAATLPERIALARRDQLDYASFLEVILSDEVNRRADRHLELRVRNAVFEETCRLEDFDWSTALSLCPHRRRPATVWVPPPAPRGRIPREPFVRDRMRRKLQTKRGRTRGPPLERSWLTRCSDRPSRAGASSRTC